MQFVAFGQVSWHMIQTPGGAGQACMLGDGPAAINHETAQCLEVSGAFSMCVKALTAPLWSCSAGFFVSPPTDPLQLSRVRSHARRCESGNCSSGYSEAGEGKVYSFGGVWRLIEALVIVAGLRVLHHRSPSA